MRKKAATVILFMVCVLNINAQKEYGTWSSISLDKKINKKWSVGAEAELRTIYWLRLINRGSLSLEAEYKPIKKVEIGFGYELMNTLDQKYLNYQVRNRFKADISGKQKWNRFSFTLIEGLQLTTKNDSKRIDDDGSTDTYRINPAFIWKNKLRIEYNIRKSKFTPGYEFTSYYELNDPDGNSFEKIRNLLYVKYKINKQNSMKFFGAINSELGSDDAEQSGKYILGVNYSIDL